jgi:hypothetical protein
VEKESRGSWGIVSRGEIHDNRWISAPHHDVATPDATGGRS